MKILSIIPARAGSRRVENKNIKLLSGRPLISYTIAAALSARTIGRTIVSTDSEEIALIGRACGAEVPFLRPSRIAQGDSTELEFLEHALDWLMQHEGYEPDLIVILYPTSPFRSARQIDDAVNKIIECPDADSLRSVRLCSEHPYKMWMENDGRLTPFVKHEDTNTHTLSYQLLPKVYIQNASIYITKPKTIWEKRSAVGDYVVPFIMDELSSIDINQPTDFEFAEYIMNSRVE